LTDTLRAESPGLEQLDVGTSPNRSRESTPVKIAVIVALVLVLDAVVIAAGATMIVRRRDRSRSS